jgi:hypothetical protein
MQNDQLAVVEAEEEAKAIVKAIAVAITIAITIAIPIAVVVRCYVSVTDVVSPLSTGSCHHTSSVLFLPFFCFLIIDC